MKATGRILVCDDCPRVAQSIVVILSAAGYRAEWASNALDCVSFAREERPSLILMDVVMPGINGVLAAGMFRDEPQFQGIPVIMLSGLPEDEVRDAAEESGAIGYLTKPFRKEDLLALIRKHAGDPTPHARAG